MEGILQAIGSWVTSVISFLGYRGVFLGMLLESACIPIPSELIMPFAGFLAGTGQMDLFSAIMAGSLGGTAGCILAYWIGYRYAHWIEGPLRFIIPAHEVRRAQKWLVRHGDIVGFTTRLLPGIRTFISLPMGMARVPFFRFVSYSFLGTFIWCSILAYIGWILGEHWTNIKVYMHYADVVVVLGIIGVIGWYFWKKKNRIFT